MGKSAPSSQTVTQRVEIPRFLRPFVEQAAATQAGALGNIESIVNAPGDNLVAGFTPAQLAAQQQAIDVAGGAGGFIPTAQQALLSSARGDFLAGGPGFNEAVQASIRAAQPSILSSFGAAGRGVSGLGQVAIQQAASDAFAGLFNQERNRQLQSAALLPQIGLAGSDILSTVGGQQQAQAQRQIEAPLAAQERLLSAAAGTVPVTSVFGQSTTQPLFRNQAAGALGGGLAGLGVAGQLGLGGLGQIGLGGAGALLGLLSDEREKVDIELVADGPLMRSPVHAWRYKDDPPAAQKRIGPIAQEVEAVDPAAVTEIDREPQWLLDTGKRKWVVDAHPC